MPKRRFEDWPAEIEAFIRQMYKSGQSEGIVMADVLKAMFDQGELRPEMADAIALEFIEWAHAVREIARHYQRLGRIRR